MHDIMEELGKRPSRTVTSIMEKKHVKLVLKKFIRQVTLSVQ